MIAKSIRVLIVEDSAADALILVTELRRGGYDPTFERVETSDAMTAALANQKWDIVFADNTMAHFRETEALVRIARPSISKMIYRFLLVVRR